MRPYYYFICVHSSIGLSPYTVRIKVLSRFERNCIRIQNISNDIYAVPFINPYKILKFSFVYFKSKSEIFSDFKRLLFNLEIYILPTKQNRNHSIPFHVSFNIKFSVLICNGVVRKTSSLTAFGYLARLNCSSKYYHHAA